MLLLHKRSVLFRHLALSIVSVAFTEVVLMAMKKTRNLVNEEIVGRNGCQENSDIVSFVPKWPQGTRHNSKWISKEK